MQVTGAMRELIKIDLKNKVSINNIMKKYGVKKTYIRTIQSELEEVVQQVVQVVGQQDKEPVKAIVGPMSDIVVQEDNIIINDLINNHKVLMEMIEKYKSNNVVPTGDIVVQLPYEEDKSYKISMRVNKPVMDQFKEFCSSNKNFSQKDLLSMALVEYMENHK